MKRYAMLTSLVTVLLPGYVNAQQLAVVSRQQDVIVFHELPGGEEVARVPVGRDSHEMALGPTGRLAYVPSYGGTTVVEVDLYARTGRRFDTGPHGALHGAVARGAVDRLWVTAEESQSILEIDLASGEIVQTWPTHGEQSHMVTATADGQKLYVANMRSGTVSVVDRRDGSVRTLPTGGGAEGIDVSPDNREVWVSNRADETISVIDTESDEVVATFSSHGVFPVKVRFRPNGEQVWVVNNRSQGVAVFDRASRALVGTIEVGERPLGIVFSDDGRRAYVTRPGAPEVVVIDAESHQVVHRFPTGVSADGMVWIRD